MSMLMYGHLVRNFEEPNKVDAQSPQEGGAQPRKTADNESVIRVAITRVCYKNASPLYNMRLEGGGKFVLHVHMRKI